MTTAKMGARTAPTNALFAASRPESASSGTCTYPRRVEQEALR